MNVKNPCPCCSNTMLRHLSGSHSYWYCSSCRIEMPNIERQKAKPEIAKLDRQEQFPPKLIKSIVPVSQKIKTTVSL